MIVETEGARIHVERAGAGDPLLLIAGITADSASWAPVLEPLAAARALIMPDNRGCGRTQDDGGALSIETMADDARAALDACGIDKADIVGHSMGGIIAMRLASAYPGRVRRLVLYATAPEIPARSRAAVEALTKRREAGMDDEVWLRLFFPWLFCNAFFEKPGLLDAAVAMAKAYPHRQSPADMRRQADAISRFDPAGLADRLAEKTLILAGAEDLLFPPTFIQRTSARFAEAETKVLSDAAHSVHWDDPALFVSAILDFLDAD